MCDRVMILQMKFTLSCSVVLPSAGEIGLKGFLQFRSTGRAIPEVL